MHYRSTRDRRLQGKNPTPLCHQCVRFIHRLICFDSLANENNELLRLLGRPERDIDALLSHPSEQQEVLPCSIWSLTILSVLINHYPASEASNETLQEQQEVVASSINEPFNRIPTTEEYHRSPRIGSGPRPFLVPPAASTSGLIDQPQVHSTPLPPPQGCFTNPQSNSFPASSAPTTSHSHWLSLPSVTAPDPFMPMMGGTPAANSMLDFGSSSTNPFDMLFNPHLPQETRDQAPPNGH